MRTRVVCLMALLLVLAVGAANADTITAGGVTWDVTVSGQTVTMIISTTAAGCNFGALQSGPCTLLGEVDVKAFSLGNSGSLLSTTQPAAYNTGILATVGGNNGGGTCSTTNNSGFVCWSTGTGVSLVGAHSYTFTATFSGATAISPFSIQATFYNGTLSSKVYQISTSTGTVPEPASLTLLGSGLLALAGFTRRKLLR